MSSLAVVPNHLQQRIDALEHELANRTRQLESAEEALRAANALHVQVTEGSRDLRRVLLPLYTALQKVFGEIDVMSVPEAAVGGGEPAAQWLDPRKRQVWEAWKTKLPGIPAKMIDALLVHGSLNQTQLRIHAQCARSSVPNAVMALNRAGLINKSGDGKISLKEL
jgi:hypothetical protein